MYPLIRRDTVVNFSQKEINLLLAAIKAYQPYKSCIRDFDLEDQIETIIKKLDSLGELWHGGQDSSGKK